jgi:hypothetical protein
MRLQTRQILAALFVLLALVAAKAQAQVDVPFGPEQYSHDFQMFAPVQIDMDNQPYQDNYGYWGTWSKLWWSFSGEHVTIGDPDVVVLAERIYTQNPNDIGVAPEPYQIQNGIQNAIPNAGFAWGDRYEFGHRDRGNGWTIGILDGPTQQQNKTYGMTETLTGTTLPPWDVDYRGEPLFPGQDPSVPTPGQLNDFFALGFGNTHVNFATPAGYLQGFRDYLNNLVGAATGTQGGPVLYVGNYGGIDEALEDDDFTFYRVADDINENGVPGSIIIFVPDPNDPTILIPTVYTDFGDLHTFNVAFDQVQVRSRTKMSGVEAMWSHELTNRHYQAKHQNNHIEVSAGARFMMVEDYFYFLGDGGILGRTYSHNWLDNQIVGPQVAAKWTNQRQRWRFTANTRFMFGYNIMDWSQENGIGAELVPGALNRPMYAQPTYSYHGLSFDDFSPVGELRLETAYYLTKAVALKLGYTGTYIGNIKRASTSVRYYLPDMGYRDSGTQDLISNGVDMGIEFVY